MWQSATAAAVALAQQQHLLFGGLGGIIAVIVGGVISIIAMRNAKRNEAQPAPIPQPAPASRRHNPPSVYGEPAPPTSPSRRLHPGPISLSEPSRPQQSNDDDEFATNLFDPDIFSDEQTASEKPPDTLNELSSNALPLLRPASHITSEWRAQASPMPSQTYAPVWNHHTPFSRPTTPTVSPSAYESLTSVAPPIWRIGPLSARQTDIFASAGSSALSFAEPATSSAPVWTSWLQPAAPDANRLPNADTDTPTETSTDAAPPIWPSFLRQE